MTDQRASRPSQDGKSLPAQPPSISLPKGGGAIRGINEKPAANPVTGTGSMAVPISTSPGRADFGPALSLAYDSGAGNGPWGLGWSLPLPSITRKTAKGLPRYRDADESDTFILSGAEDLVPSLNSDGSRYEDEDSAPGYRIHRYRPRVEGLFARIERWTRIDQPADVHWRSISPDNLLTIYGLDESSRLFDPTDPNKVFSWLICETRDDTGQAIVYRYKSEDGTGVDLTHCFERNRGDVDDARRTANRYLKNIYYGNREPLLDAAGKRPLLLTPAETQQIDWMFEVVFDYGEHATDAPTPDDAGPWDLRADAFSQYRAGFEIRTARLCKRILMFHHFENENGIGNECLVQSTDFEYSHELDPDNADHAIYTFLQAARHHSYKREGETYLKRHLPPLELQYSRAIIQDRVEELDAQSLENLPSGVDGTRYQWIDLHSEGTPGVLTEQADAWHFKRNLSPRTEGPARLGPLTTIASKPNLSIADGGRLMDLAGDGQLDVAVLDGPMPGFYEHDGQSGWQGFRAFESQLHREIDDPNLRLVDLTGDGHADVLITEHDALVWHASLAEEGFAGEERVNTPLDDELGPRLVFADSTDSIFLTDLSGDGLSDLARIRNGEICYWPNLGYGRFGAKITMDQAPHFDSPEQFDAQRIRLADIDGSGTTDLIYLHGDGVRLYFNQSGNSWSEARTLSIFPRADDLDSILPLDLLGNGTTCLVWSSMKPGDRRRSVRYVDLMGGQKPHLLVRTINNLGAETRLHYAPSTRFYLQDELDGRPWLTRLPFPVHVVERVEAFDHISRNRFVTRYAYHHGYFDGVEREFRGFGMVEQWDTEELAAWTLDGTLPDGPQEDSSSHVPPVLTKTWFHTGMKLSRHRASSSLAGLVPGYPEEYYREPGLNDEQASAQLLPDTILPDGLTVREEREAVRALSGGMLRQEIYALDGSLAEPHPYSVIEQNYSLRRLQPGSEHHGVFLVHALEAVTYHYERNPSDARIQHAMTLEVDEIGNVLKEVGIGYGRRSADLELPLADDRTQQTEHRITYSENEFTHPIDLPAAYRTPLASEGRTYELIGYTATGDGGRFRASDFVLADPSNPNRLAHQFDTEILFEPTTGRQRRLIEHACTLFRPDDLGASENDPLALLPLHQIESMALPGEGYELALSSSLLGRVFERDGQALLPMPADVLGATDAGGGGYVDLHADGNWWIPSGRVFFSPNTTDPSTDELAEARAHFFVPRRLQDPFQSESSATYDPYDLLMLETQDALGNRITIGERLPNGDLDPSRPGNDYRLLQPWRMMDANRNRTEVAFDTLGMVVGSAVMGKPEDGDGDSLEGFVADLSESEIMQAVADPFTVAPTLLARATSRLVYDVLAYQRSQNQSQSQPAVIYTMARETHDGDLDPGQKTLIQHSFAYSDGMGREIQQKIQAEPGPVPKRDAEGVIVFGPDGRPEMTEQDVAPRWVASGWSIFNNKGQPVRQYEPFFSDTHHFELNLRVGVSPVLFYDPVGRVIATLNPDHTYNKVTFDAWHQTTWDANDTVLNDPRTDPDIYGYTAGYFAGLSSDATVPPWQTWYARRQTGLLGPHEQAAAEKAAVHADTPVTAHFDTLGRTFLTVTQNKVACDGHPLDGQEETLFNRVELDIEGNARRIRDALEQDGDAEGRVVMEYDYDLLGNPLRHDSMESGSGWTLNDVAGQSIRSWDSRGHMFRTEYDPLRRPLRHFVIGADPADPSRELMIDRSVYGEQHPEAEQRNLRGAAFLVLDSAGVSTIETVDFKGSPLSASRRLVTDYKETVEWGAIEAAIPSNSTDLIDLIVLEAALSPLLSPETYTSHSQFDALDRPLSATSPDGSVVLPQYNEANLLEKLDINLRGEKVNGQPQWTPFVAGIDYDAKGQRRYIDYGNGTRTSYEYDPLTLRVVRLVTRRDAAAFPGDCPQPSPSGWPGCQAQDLSYTYDPVGNITDQRDDAQQTIYFNNQRVEPSADYTYDAIYRLIQATGREHLGQSNSPRPHHYDDAQRTALAHPGDGLAMGGYVERYVYDAVGNFLEMRHRSTTPPQAGWTRSFTYAEPSSLEPTKTNNRLSRTAVGQIQEIYSRNGDGYDVHGNMLQMPHLNNMTWDFKDQLQQSQRQAVGPDDANGQSRQGERTYYVYDGNGQRVRKVTELENGTLKDERIYLGGFEIYRKHSGAHAGLVRETLHVMDDENRIALVETRTQGTDPAPARLIRYQLSNHLGSAGLELDDQAQVISYEEYTPYGSTSYRATRADIAPKRYRFTGKERDEENGLSYHGARYYAPWLARWAAADPAGLVDGDNLYRYSRNNPIRFFDPNGMETASPKPPPPSPKIGPIREGMLIGDDPGLSHQWQQAVEGVLQRRYGKGSYQKNFRAFKQHLRSLPRGSNRRKGTRIHLARRVFNASNRAFRRRVSLPTGTQVHHSFEGLAASPERSLNASGLQVAKGNAGSPGTSHHRAHRAEDLAKAGVKNPGRQATQEMQAAREAKRAAAAAKPKTTAAAKKPTKPVVKPRTGSKGRGGRRSTGKGGKAGGVIAVAGLVLLAADVAEAKTAEERKQVLTDAGEGAAKAWAVSKIPFVGAPAVAIVGAATTGYAAGERLAKHVIPDEANIAIGEVVVHKVLGISKDDLSLLDGVNLGEAALQGLGEAITEDLLGVTTKEGREELESFSIGGWHPFGP